jgi:DNA-binding Xre family transcriptional regulator
MIIKRLSEKMGISQANVKKLVKNGKIPASMLTAGEVIGDK